MWSQMGNTRGDNSFPCTKDEVEEIPERAGSSSWLALIKIGEEMGFAAME